MREVGRYARHSNVERMHAAAMGGEDVFGYYV
jgi:hypothetical protein